MGARRFGCIVMRRATGAAIANTDLGFEPGDVLSVNQRGKSSLVPQAAAVLAADPRIEQVVVTSRNPLFGELPKSPIVEAGRVVPVTYSFVSSEYFTMLGIPIVHGRGFLSEEAHEKSGVAIVSASAAQALWPGEEPVGKTLRLPLGEPQTGVADTVHNMIAVNNGHAPEGLFLTIVGVA